MPWVRHDMIDGACFEDGRALDSCKLRSVNPNWQAQLEPGKVEKFKAARSDDCSQSHVMHSPPELDSSDQQDMAL